MDVASYDLVVIGSGPAGQKAAIAAAKLDDGRGLQGRRPRWTEQTLTLPEEAGRR
jgi:thioredoxin reductase